MANVLIRFNGGKLKFYSGGSLRLSIGSTAEVDEKLAEKFLTEFPKGMFEVVEKEILPEAEEVSPIVNIPSEPESEPSSEVVTAEVTEEVGEPKGEETPEEPTKKKRGRKKK